MTASIISAAAMVIVAIIEAVAARDRKRDKQERAQMQERQELQEQLKTDDLKYLRADVRANCEIFLQMCHDAGLPVKVTETVRDEEYQLDCVRRGTASKKATKPTFHGIKAGLAFDICKNVNGHAYDDADFFARCGQIGKQVGFSWGGDWRSFPDRPHFQWDANGRYSSSMILAGKYPPQMEEYDYMDQDKFDAMMDTYLAKRAQLPVDEWAAEVWAAAHDAGIVNGTAPKGLVTRQEVIAMIARSKPDLGTAFLFEIDVHYNEHRLVHYNVTYRICRIIFN